MRALILDSSLIDVEETLDRACIRAIATGRKELRGYFTHPPKELEWLKKRLEEKKEVIRFTVMRLNRSPKLHFEIGLMLYAERRPLQFLHITKCAGTSIENWGHEHGFRWGRFFTKGKNLSLKPPHRDLLKGDLFHVPPSFFEVNPYEYSDLFTVVRNPYTRAISEFRCPWYGYCSPVKTNPDTLQRRVNNLQNRDLSWWLHENSTRLERRRTATKEDLNAWLMRKAAKGAMSPPFKKAHLIPQSLYLEGVKYVLRFERLADEFSHLCGLYGFLGLEGSLCRRDNGSEMPLFHMEDLHTDTIAMLNEQYASDFEALGYERVGSRGS